jgi:hypothetical protein
MKVLVLSVLTDAAMTIEWSDEQRAKTPDSILDSFDPVANCIPEMSVHDEKHSKPRLSTERGMSTW